MGIVKIILTKELFLPNSNQFNFENYILILTIRIYFYCLSFCSRKKYLISRDELELEWRPLYDLCLRVFESSKSDLGMYRCFSNLEETVISTIRSVRM